MIKNIDLFNLCIENKEPYLDKYYSKKATPIITEDLLSQNDLMNASLSILENISAYKIAIDSKNKTMQESILNNILDYLNIKGINFTEFVSYWAVKDVSYSVYKKTLITNELKKDFLKNILPKYIKERHSLYSKHGYSFSTIQVLNDSKAHKENSSSGKNKVSDILNSFNFKKLEDNNLNNFLNKDSIYIYPDNDGKKIFKDIINYFNINFKWSNKHEGKQTDFLFKKNNKIFIMEHKHMKESGGGQDKQMSEIIDFISYRDKNVHYISFLDGIYFNLLVDNKIKSGKPFTQKNDIINILYKNYQNYFVNTYGFIKLLENLNK